MTKDDGMTSKKLGKIVFWFVISMILLFGVMFVYTNIFSDFYNSLSPSVQKISITGLSLFFGLYPVIYLTRNKDDEE